VVELEIMNVGEASLSEDPIVYVCLFIGPRCLAMFQHVGVFRKKRHFQDHPFSFIMSYHPCTNSARHVLQNTR
jgi:hypothetical protein